MSNKPENAFYLLSAQPFMVSIVPLGRPEMQ
jgi:hypothetical protein